MIGYSGNVDIYGTDKKIVQVCKIMKECRCSMCRKKLPSGSVVVSKDSWIKFCLDCQPQFFKRIREELKRFDDLMKNTETDLKLNMEKYKTQNIASLI